MPIVKVNREVLAARIRKRLKQMQVTALTIPDTGPGDCWADCCNCCSSSGGGGGGGGCGDCGWEWQVVDGVGTWVVIRDSCTGACVCSYPLTNGTVDRERTTSACATSLRFAKNLEKKVDQAQKIQMRTLYLSLTNHPTVKTTPLLWTGGFWESSSVEKCVFRLYKEDGIETWILEENWSGSVTKTKGVPTNTEPFFMMGNLISAACKNSKFLITE